MCINHKWKRVEDYQFDEKLSQFMSKFESIEFGGSFASCANGLAKRGVISVAECAKCGTVKHIKTIL